MIISKDRKDTVSSPGHNNCLCAKGLRILTEMTQMVILCVTRLLRDSELTSPFHLLGMDFKAQPLHHVLPLN